ncbi:MAG: ParB/RepB/Spo0J family partition protein [Eubacteriales bacterium]|nr:ParB/RepB/Spo0J family partition protein [Eubacteriales bacterium]
MAVFDLFKSEQKQPAQEPQKEKQPEKRSLIQVPIGDIRPNPNQPRKAFSDDTIEELADSIRQVGIIQPLVVRRIEGGYELVAGERRLRACKLIGMEAVPCILSTDVYEEDSAMMALIENLQRENLHYLEEAECYAALIQNYGLKQEELAARVGKSQSAVANKLRVLRLSPNIKAAMTEARMTERHARALLRIRDEETQMKIIDKVKEKSLSVKETEKLVDKTLNRLYDEKQEGAKPRPKILRYIRDYRLFVNTVNSAANQLRDSGFTVEFDQAELENGVDITIRVRQ